MLLLPPAEDTLALLLSAVRQQGSHSLVHIDPADPSSVVRKASPRWFLSGFLLRCTCCLHSLRPVHLHAQPLHVVSA